MPGGTGTAGRPRSQAADGRIRDAVLDLLREAGPAAATMEAVAVRSGVAKTTLYRRFARREEMLRDVLKGALGEPSIPADGGTREKTRAALEQTWQQFEQVLGRGGIAALVLDQDPAFSQLFRDVVTPYEQALVDLIRTDVAAGLLRHDLDAESVTTMFVGAYLGELVRRGRVGPDWLEQCLDLLWPALVPRQD